MAKVYASPVPYQSFIMEDFDAQKEFAREEGHRNDLRNWLNKNGFSGKNNGQIVRFPVADGAAEYMIAEGKGKFFLIHLPYGDAYHYRHIEHLPKKAILEEAVRAKKLAEFLAKQRRK